MKTNVKEAFWLKAMALILSFSSCINDMEMGVPCPTEGTPTTFTINVPRSSLPATRAVVDGSVEDNAVNEVTILLFEKTGGAYSGSAAATEITTDATNSYKKTFTVVLPGGEYNALVIANANAIFDAFKAANPDYEEEDLAFFEDNLSTAIITGNATAGYTPWNANPANATYKPFPMAGRFDIPAERTSSLGTIFLTRMPAKVNIKLAFDQTYVDNRNTIFRLEAVNLPHFNTIGNLIPADRGEKALSVFDQTQLNIPTTAGYVSSVEKALSYTDLALMTASAAGVPEQQIVDEIFLPELIKSTDPKQKPCVLLEIWHPTLQQNRWYKVDLQMENPATTTVEPINLLRNFRYTINITAITGNGFATIEEAYEAPAEGTVTEITAIDESDMNDITFDGRNQLTVNKSNFLFHATGDNQELKIFTDYTQGWEIESVSSTWLHISSSAGQSGVTLPTTMKCDAYTGNTVRTGDIVITAGPLRKTIHVIQVPDLTKVTDVAYASLAGFNRYVGAFWKANQTGERLIRIPRPANINSDGAWTAVVLEGKDWIQLDTVMTTDKNVGWLAGADETSVDNGNDVGFDSRHQILGNQSWVADTLDINHPQIYFRIGLNGHYNATEDKPARYGVVLLAYNNYTKLQRIFIRQGEAADYLMAPGDPNSKGAIVEKGRTYAQKFAPYNLTDPARNTDVNTSLSSPLPVGGAEFVDYPSQAGYLFRFNTNYALQPTPPGNTLSSIVNSTTTWDPTVNETCPEGYRRVQDGKMKAWNAANDTGSSNGSEVRQSLWLNPPIGNANTGAAATYNADNLVSGYYADGYFDRRAIGNSINNTLASAVASPGTEVAYKGILLFNSVVGSSHQNASLFFPSAGQYSQNGTSIGMTGNNTGTWASTWAGNTSVWNTGWNSDYSGWPGVFGSSTNYAFAIRCVKDEPMYPPTGTVAQMADANTNFEFAGFVPYIGAFWKADQTGERLIRIPRVLFGNSGHGVEVADGIWEAQVMEGKDWITLDTLMTIDPNVGWRTDVVPDESQVDDPLTMGASFDSKHPVTGNRWWVRGMLKPEVPQIYFRIGLKSKYTPTADKPARYGVVLLSYANGTKTVRLWIRQGEGADYVFSDKDPITTGGLTARTATVKWSPYNLTAATLNAPVSINGATGDPAMPPAIFTKYPTQAGAYWQWASDTRTRYAWSPIGNQTVPNWDTAGVPATDWDTNAATNESCPAGYRRPADGPTAGLIDRTDISQSEVQQSLWMTPNNTNGSGISWAPSFVFYGNYADGYFDRRKVEATAVGSNNHQHNVVAANTPDVAYRGTIFFNTTTYASLFIPFTGDGRTVANSLGNPGVNTAYWTSGSTATNTASDIGILNILQSSTGGGMNAKAKSTALPIRCVKEE